jgi:hypothetical protein
MLVILGLTFGRGFCLHTSNPRSIRLSYTLRNPRGACLLPCRGHSKISKDVGNKPTKKGVYKIMKLSKGSLVLTAAFTGLLGGTMTRLNASTISSNSAGQGFSSSSSLAGQASGNFDDKKEKHACKGQNSCKGKGGCKTSDNGCKGKNSCKGKGGCATDGSNKKKTT